MSISTQIKTAALQLGLAGAMLASGVSTSRAGGGAAAASARLIPYEGTLMHSGTPANGDFEMRFYLCASEDSCSPSQNLWSESRSETVSNGRFAVALGEVNGLGSTVFSVTTLYLGIDVRSPATGEWVALGGTQRILPVPYAVRGAPESDFTAGDSNELFVNRATHRVGVGTETPQAALTVAGAVGGQTHVEGGFIDSTGRLTIGAGVAGPASAEDVVIGGQHQIHVQASSGNVGMGADARSDARLNVEGKLYANGPIDSTVQVHAPRVSAGVLQTAVQPATSVDKWASSTFYAGDCSTPGEIQVKSSVRKQMTVFGSIADEEFQAICFCSKSTYLNHSFSTTKWYCIAPN